MSQYLHMRTRSIALSLLALAAASVLAQTHAVEASSATNAVLPVPENFVVDGIPPIPLSVVDNVRRYTEFRSGSFQSWDPVQRRMLIETRFADAAQVHMVAFPGGDRRQLTFYPDPIGGASFSPATSTTFMFSKDVGGNEFFQLYTYDLNSGNTRMLTDGKSANTDARWSNAGDRVIYNASKRHGTASDFWIAA